MASSVDMVLSMGWLVEPPAAEHEPIAALCAKCRVYKKGPVRAPAVPRGSARTRQVSLERTDQHNDVVRPRDRPRS